MLQPIHTAMVVFENEGMNALITWCCENGTQPTEGEDLWVLAKDQKVDLECIDAPAFEWYTPGPDGIEPRRFSYGLPF